MRRALAWLAWKVDPWIPGLPRLTGVWCALTAILLARAIAALAFSSATAGPLALLSLADVALAVYLLRRVRRGSRRTHRGDK